MSDVIIRGANGRRHEVDFGADRIRIVPYPGDEHVELLGEADIDEIPEGKRRFALVNVPRHLLSKALADAARGQGVREARRHADRRTRASDEAGHLA